MPELPEVESIRIGLQTYLVGHTIQNVTVRMPKMLSGDVTHIIESTVTGVRRFGKGLVIDLSNNFSIAVHVKMTGQLIYTGPKVPRGTQVSKEKVGKLPKKATHLIFHLDHDAVLYYNDQRQFGWVKIVETEKVFELPFFKDLGPEALKDLTFETFAKILSSTKSAIKPLLMEQKKMSGVGNIYANDALYVAKIHPKRPANSLTKEEMRVLFDALEEVLKKGLAAGGSSEWAYVNALGEEGSYQKIFLVYGKDNTPCPRCNTVIERITLGSRGTFFCPTCQS